jgi:hypothetical protein
VGDGLGVAIAVGLAVGDKVAVADGIGEVVGAAMVDVGIVTGARGVGLAVAVAGDDVAGGHVGVTSETVALGAIVGPGVGLISGITVVDIGVGTSGTGD